VSGVLILNVAVKPETGLARHYRVELLRADRPSGTHYWATRTHRGWVRRISEQLEMRRIGVDWRHGMRRETQYIYGRALSGVRRQQPRNHPVRDVLTIKRAVFDWVDLKAAVNDPRTQVGSETSLIVEQIFTSGLDGILRELGSPKGYKGGGETDAYFKVGNAIEGLGSVGLPDSGNRRHSIAAKLGLMGAGAAVALLCGAGAWLIYDRRRFAGSLCLLLAGLGYALLGDLLL
jgi:hypothetical protein